jgi:hypothetical protein
LLAGIILPAILHLHIAPIETTRVDQSFANLFTFSSAAALPLSVFLFNRTFIQEAVHGAISIRAYNVTDKFIADSRRRVDNNLMCFYPSLCSNRYCVIFFVANFQFAVG